VRRPGARGLARHASSSRAWSGEIPAYQQNIHQKIRDIRGFSEGGVLDDLRIASEKIAIELGLAQPPPDPNAAPPPVVSADPANGRANLDTARRLLERLAAAGLVVALVIFMLLEREPLRGRLVRLFGHGRLVATTRAFDEAGWRVSRYLLAQSLVNVMFGVSVGIGMYLIGMPYPLLWATLAGVARYVPYVGATVAAVVPLLVSLSLSGWTKPFLVLGLFTVLELITNLVFETAVYAGVAGISQVALLVGVAFWGWLWGPFGILLATPLTVCLGVMGKHVPGLGFVSTLISDEPVLDPDITYYQRLLANDKAEAIEIVERFVDDHPPETVYDAIMVRALNYAERDRIEERLTAEEEREVIETTRELLDDTPLRAKLSEAHADEDGEGAVRVEPLRVLAVPANGEGDAGRAAHARRSARSHVDLTRSPDRQHADVGDPRNGPARAAMRGADRRSASERSVQVALSREAVAREGARPADSRGPVGTARARRRECRCAAGGRRDARGVDARRKQGSASGLVPVTGAACEREARDPGQRSERHRNGVRAQRRLRGDVRA
jgi:hypothetical protein